MVYYLQRESIIETALPADSILRFETLIEMSETDPPDFVYNEDGSIDIMRRGTYVVLWYVSGMTGLSASGQSFLLKRRDYSAQGTVWANAAGTSNRLNISQTPGFAVISVTKDEIDLHGMVTIALFNIAEETAKLTPYAPKMGILFYGVDLKTMDDRMTEIDGEIVNLFDALEEIERFVHLSDVAQRWAQAPELAGAGVSVIYSGYTYNFWGIGTLNHQQTLNQGQRYYLLESWQYEALTFYQGESTIGTLWIETPPPASTIHYLPIRFDGTGIYFEPDVTYSNLLTGTAFKFTQALILVDLSRLTP
jgi:hypothetical protein